MLAMIRSFPLPLGKRIRVILPCIPLSYRPFPLTLGKTDGVMLVIARSSPLPLGERVRVRGSLFQSRVYHIDNTFKFIRQLIIPKPQYHDAFLFQILIPLLILDDFPRLAMLPTIQLNDQFRFSAIKIQNVWPERLLPSKLRAQDFAVSQVVPKFSLGFRRVVAEGFGQ
jgi:hypothetical protein